MQHSKKIDFRFQRWHHLEVMFLVSNFCIYSMSLNIIIITDINEFHEVDQICEQFSANWKKIGGRLNITRNTIDIIGKDNNDKVKECMSELIAKWLRRETPKQPPPTWNILCDAIATVDMTAAQRIAREKGVPIMHAGMIIMITTRL